MKVRLAHHHLRSGWDTEPTESNADQTLVLAFGSTQYGNRPEVFQGLRDRFPAAVIVGCSTAGEIVGTEVHDDSLVVATTHFEHSRLRLAATPCMVAADSEAAGKQLANTLNAPDLVAVFVLSDGLCVNGTALVRGLNEVLPKHVTVSGGLAADGSRFEKTWILVNDRPTTGHVAAVGFYGDRLHVTHGCEGGWDRFGPERAITRSEDNVLYELDGQPALQLYKEYLGDRADGLPAAALLFPLLIHGSDTANSVVRTILAVDEEAQSMTFAGDIPQGSRAQLMRANHERLISGAEAAAQASAIQMDQQALVLAVSCVGRRLVLGQLTEEEVEVSLAVFPEGSVQVGFYSYGELSPLPSGACGLHNQTMTITALSER